METPLRRFDIDWLRVIAIGLLLIYHVAIPFQPWGMFIGFIKSNESLESLWMAMSMINIWRIPLLFFVSGMGVYFSIRRRDWKALLKERTMRILLPFIVGIFTIVPLHVLLWQFYYHQELSYVANPAHLWFLGNIFSYVLIFAPLFFYLKNNEDKWKAIFSKIFDNPFKLLLVSIPFIIAVSIINPDSYPTYAMNAHGYFLGLLAFLFGFLFVFTGKAFWDTVKKWKWPYLIIALIMYFIRLWFFELEGPGYLMSIETLLWIYAILGIAYTYLNFGNSYLKYLSEAAYPVYILHWIFIHLGSLLLFNINIPVQIQFLGLVLFTLIGSLATYHLIIRRIKIIRPLFGLKIVVTKSTE